MDEYSKQLKKASDFHGHICGGIAIGTKLAMYGLDLMNMELNKKNKNLIVFLEIDRCMSDAVQAVTGCSMGKRSLKQMYYGKFATTFYDMDTGKALRISDKDANKKYKNEETKEEMIERFTKTPAEELFKVEKVKIDLKQGEMPGKPYTSVFCSICNEKVSDGRHKVKGGKPVCISCADGSYYELIEN
ncbi:MAG: TraR/DksA C4-type zinc finger protein [Methanobacteriaceae archaeon]|jgi:formylmethanofuran dehydrogenase subunit E|nr:TraR/DksA C4-type zinc finger protein [Methanobacteriaceae archaeon]